MTAPVFLSPSRVREIAKQFSPKGAPGAEAAIRAAMPEGAAAALEWAAKRIEGRTDITSIYETAAAIRQMAKEIKP